MEKILSYDEANKTVHKVENEWHYSILTEFGWKPETKENTGFVRSYRYINPNKDYTITCTTGNRADYWERTCGLGGYCNSLRPWLEENA